MKKIILILILFVDLFATNPTWTTPDKVGVSAFAVNNYSYATPLTRAIYHKDAFIDSLLSAVGEYYPSMLEYVAYDNENSLATVLNYKSALLYHSEFVFFSGHGNQQSIALYDLPMTVSEGCSGSGCNVTNYGKVYGGETRWVFFDACLVLNVNQNNKVHLPLTTATIDYTKVAKLISVFRGVHAILGYYSLSWENAIVNGNGVEIEGTEELYRYFVKYFIEDGENIWDAFNEANADIYRDFDNVFMLYNSHATGLTPAIAFLEGYDENGLYHDTSTETFNHTFNSPINITGTLQMLIKYYEHGVPQYY